MIVEEDSDDAPCGARRAQWISEVGGLRQFGAFIETLYPDSRSSIKHWHSAEDEMVYVLEGNAILIEGSDEFVLRPGDAATFRAGHPVGHCLANRGTTPVRYLVIGTRSPLDRITYPDHDRICVRDRALPGDLWTDGAGKPASNPYTART